MSIIFGTVEIPVVLEMPLDTTRDDIRVEDAVDPESKAKTDKEMLWVNEEVYYEGLTENEEAMIDAAIQASLEDASLADPSVATTTSKLITGTEA